MLARVSIVAHDKKGIAKNGTSAERERRDVRICAGGSIARASGSTYTHTRKSGNAVEKLRPKIMKFNRPLVVGERRNAKAIFFCPRFLIGILFDIAVLYVDTLYIYGTRK